MHNQVQCKFDNLASEYSNKYTRPNNIWHLEKIRRMELLLEYAQLRRPQSALDAGCGSGVVLSALESRLPGLKVAGVDLSYLMLKQAQRNNLRAARLVQSLVERLPFADESFDLIYALGVIDYLENPSQFFETVWRIVTPGGCFIFTYPNGDSIKRTLRALFTRNSARSDTGVSATAIRGATIARLLVQHRFELLERRYITYGNGIFALPWSVNASRRMETWCNGTWFSRYLAWSCLCVVCKRTGEDIGSVNDESLRSVHGRKE